MDNPCLQILHRPDGTSDYPELKKIEPNMKLQPGTIQKKKGVCLILISPPYGNLGWHMSISAPNRYPTWDEIKEAWYENVPDAENKWGAMFFPPKSEYVNVHPYCFHIHETTEKCKNIRIE